MTQQPTLLPLSWLVPGGRETDDELRDVARPTTRDECPPRESDGTRLCPWVGCRYHCAVHVRETGELQVWSEERAVGKPTSVQARWRRQEPELEIQDRVLHAIDGLVERYGSPCSLDWDARYQMADIGARLGCGEWSAHKAYDDAIAGIVVSLDMSSDDAELALAILGTEKERTR